MARLAFYFSCFLTAAYTAWILFFPITPEAESAVSSILIIFLLLLTIIFGVFILRSAGFPVVLRRTWVLIALAAFSQLVAECIWFYEQTILKVNPFPSSADFFYFFYYIFLFTAILFLPFTPPKQQERTLLIMDIAIVMLVAILFMYYFVLAPLHPDIHGPWTLDLIVVSIYPCLDLLILAALFSILQRDVERVSREIILFLSISMVFTLLADLGWLVLGSYLSEYPQTLLDWLWTMAVLAMLLAAYWQYSQPVHQSMIKTVQFKPFLRDLMLYFVTGAAFLLVLITAIDLKISDMRYYAVVLVGITVGALVMIRQYIILAENRRLYHEMERLATIDQLTGLNNRRSFDRAIEMESKRSERFGHPYSVLMMDVDNFKLYNDRFGHLGGDVILKRMSALLLMNLRATDFLARFGGDEFVAILPETRFENARRVATKIIEEAKNHFIQESIGLSVGVAAWEPSMSYLDVLNAADRDLYKYKQSLQR